MVLNYENKLHLLYERNKYNDVLVDDYGQLCFSFMSKCKYGVPLEEVHQPRFKSYIFDGIGIFCLANKIKYKKNGVLINDRIAPFDSVVAYTGVVDINGKPIYTKDFVKIDELGWCGFVFMTNDGGICVESPTGFSCNPNNIERICNTVVREYENNICFEPGFFDTFRKSYKDFMNDNRILMNLNKYNEYGLEVK